MNADAPPLPATACPLCGGPNACAPALAGRFDVRCWCEDATIDAAALARIPQAQRNRACLCPACAGATTTPSGPPER